MTKIEKIREMVRGKKVVPTFFNSRYERENYRIKKQAIEYLERKGYETEKLKNIIKDIEKFKEQYVVVKMEYNTIIQLQHLSARKIDILYEEFVEKCLTTEETFNNYIDMQKQRLFKLITEDYIPDYRDIKNTEMSYLFTKGSPRELEIEVEGYGKLTLLGATVVSGENFILAEHKITKEDKKAIEKTNFFLLHRDIIAGTERYSIYKVPNTSIQNFIISESDIEKIRFNGVKKFYPEKEYYYYNLGKRDIKVIKLIAKKG